MHEDKEMEKSVDIESVSVTDAQGANTEPAAEQTQPAQDAKDKTIDELTGKVAELTDKYLRVAAELENTRRRASLDVESVSRNRAMGVAEKILPVMDAIESALKHDSNNDGIKTMERAIQNAFAQIGIIKIDSIGEILNPQFHNAIQMVDKPTPETKTNTIIEEMQTGYMFGDTVLRPAMVIVSK